MRLRRLAAGLFPGYFALVMATGIVSVAAHFLFSEVVAQALLWLNIAAYVVLRGVRPLARYAAMAARPARPGGKPEKLTYTRATQQTAQH